MAGMDSRDLAAESRDIAYLTIGLSSAYFDAAM
jgi:hypothetical protein